MKFSIGSLCGRVGMSRQNYYQGHRHRQRRMVDADLVEQLVRTERAVQPRLGGRKLHYLCATHLEAAGVPRLRVKWPNDILANGRKIAGVLVEPRLGNGRIEFAVAGIGINAAQRADDFPPELRGRATSCAIEGACVSIDRMLEQLVASWRAVLEMPFAALRDSWIAAGAREEEPEV